MLHQYSSAVDAVILRHETRYDVLCEFTPAHLAWLKPVATQSTQSASKEDVSSLSNTQAFIKDKAIFKRDYVDASMCLMCDENMVRTFVRNTETESTVNTRNGSPSKIDHNVFTASSSSSSGRPKELRPEHLVGNVCLARGLSLKRKLREHINGYDSFVNSLGKLIDSVGDVHMPLHDYGAYSQGTCVADEEEGNMPPPRHEKDSLADIARAEQSRLEKIVEMQLLQKLQNNAKKFIDDTHRLEEAFRLRTQGDSDGGGSHKKRRRN
jgi:hypothetical protein